MLIDATHPEETRVVVVRNGRVEEFDFESAARKLLRGNIYLAKVTRVEPSLQAAFVDYGGNRHGFLAFNEIHPDYYQIPMADRQALLEEEAAAEAAEEAAAEAHAERMSRRRSRHGQGRTGQRSESAPADEHSERDDAGPAALAEDHGDDHDDDHPHDHVTLAESSRVPDDMMVEDRPEPEVVGGFEPTVDRDDEDDDASDTDDLDDEEDPTGDAGDEAVDPQEPGDDDAGDVQVVDGPAADIETDAVEQTGAVDSFEELPSRPRRRPRSYKIQEVIKRRQVILIQVVKEERGNKGAALTSYLSLAGRYTVLMPNTARGGGISRKITQPQDRKRLKAIAAELEVPDGMGLIIRTAGAARTSQEIKRDFEYLLRLWESVRDLTLQSTAPSLVYEEGNLIKRSIRDLYNKDVEEIVVAGQHAHNDAKDFMRMLMPSHAKNVLLHADPEPLFTKYGIERQLSAMFSPYVTLRSGGYLVINQTEALVAIDVNSGKSTREFSIEETAHATNLEASDEIARQLKLRDLAGLVVIDFIDMEEKRNNRSVERRLKDALRFDRARIQLGHISHFGLMEMSRQRLRTGVLEGSTTQCAHCQGTGIIRSTESVALAVLRGLEDALLAGQPSSLVATTTAQVALFILNNKRHFIADMEARHGISITVQASDKLQGANFTIDKGAARMEPVRRPERSAVNMNWGFEGEGDTEASSAGDDHSHDHDDAPSSDGSRIIEIRDDADDDREPRGERGEGSSSRRGGRRRRRGRQGERPARDEFRGRDGNGSSQPDRQNGNGQARPHRVQANEINGDDAGEAVADVGVSAPGLGDQPFAGQADGGRPDGDRNSRRRRRGRRGGRRGRERDGTAQPVNHVTEEFADDFAGPTPAGGNVETQPVPPASQYRTGHVDHEPARPMPPPPAAAPAETPATYAAEPERRRPRHEATVSEPRLERVVVTPDQAAAELPDAGPEKPARKGWWQRRLSGE